MRLLEPALLVAVRIGKTAAHMSEELRCQQRVGDARAVDGNQFCAGAIAALMDQLRDHFLADTTLARDEHLGIGDSRTVDVFEHPARGIADAD